MSLFPKDSLRPIIKLTAQLTGKARLITGFPVYWGCYFYPLRPDADWYNSY
jgi:hypothetical protein